MATLMVSRHDPYRMERVTKSEVQEYIYRDYVAFNTDVFSARISNLRKYLDLTQKEMAELLSQRMEEEISWRVYQRWELGKSLKRRVKPEWIFELALQLGVPVRSLMSMSVAVSHVEIEGTDRRADKKVLSNLTAFEVFRFNGAPEPCAIVVASDHVEASILVEGRHGEGAVINPIASSRMYRIWTEETRE